MELDPEDRTRLGALLLLVAVAEFSLAMLWAQAVYPGYSLQTNYISDLGVGSTALIFNVGVVIFGLLVAAGAVVGLEGFPERVQLPAAGLLLFAGIGAVFVGLEPETTGAPHLFAAGVAFGLGAVVALLVGADLWAEGRQALGAFGVAVGLLGIVALVVLAPLGVGALIGVGTVERLIAYPELLWLFVTGAVLLVDPEALK